MSVKILCVDMDAFFMSVEQASRPSLKNKKAAVVGSLKRSVVLSASYEARKQGVKTGQSVSEAIRACPELVLVKSSFKKYTYASSKIATFLKTITPTAHMYSVDEAFMNISKIDKSPIEVGYLIKSWLKENLNITGSVGVGSSHIIAKMASNIKKPDGYYEVEEKDNITFIDGFKLENIWGIGKRTVLKLNEAGIFTPAEIRRYGKAKLTEKYGLSGTYIYNSCCGIDRENPLNSKEELPKSISHSITTPENVIDSDIAFAYMLQLCEAVSAKARKKLMAGKIVTLTLRYSGMETYNFRRNLGFFTSATHHLYEICRNMFLEYSKNAPIRLFGVGLSDLAHGGSVLFNMEDTINGNDKHYSKLYNIIDEINSKYSGGIIRGSSLKISYRGEHTAPAFSSIPTDFEEK